jgi:hypothetical protein
MQARLPPDKLSKYTEDIQTLTQKHTVQLRDLRSTIGKLQFATTVIPVGRAFLRRLHDLTIGIKKPFYFITINKEAKKDLAMWQHFMSNHNGITTIATRYSYNSHNIQMCSDSSKTGFGATYGSSWIQGIWPPHWQPLNIAILELFPIYLLLALFSHKLKHSNITFFTDNQAVVHIINKQTSKCHIIMQIIRPLVLLLLQHNIHLKAAHIPGINNELCDLISRQRECRQHQQLYQHTYNPGPSIST